MKKTLLYLGLILSSVVILALISLDHFKNPKLESVGAGTPPSAYSSTLSLGESSTDTTIDVNSVVAGDTTLTTDNIYPGIFLTLEPQTSSKRELVFCTGISSSSFTGCTRGLASVGVSMAGVTANQQSHQAGVTIYASDPSQFYSHILVNRWNENWYMGKDHFKSATSSDRTGVSLGDGSDVDIMLIFKDGTATSTAPRLYRQESTGNLIWSGNGTDETTLSGGGASSTCGRGTICEATTGGYAINTATSSDTNSANRYGLSFITEVGRSRLVLSGQYTNGPFTFANLFASSTSASGTSYLSHTVPSINNAFNLGSPTSSWAGLYASGTVVFGGSSTISSIVATTTFDGLRSSINNGFDIGFWGNSFRNIYASGTVYAGSFGDTGTSTFNGGLLASALAANNSLTVAGSGTSTILQGTQITGISLSGGLTLTGGSILNTSAATSSFTGGIQSSVLNISSNTATSTFANGIQLSGGCFRDVNGTCFTPAVSGANTALSNLAAVAINTSLLSDTHNTDDLGSYSFAWKNIFASGTVYGDVFASASSSGTSTLSNLSLSGNLGSGAASALLIPLTNGFNYKATSTSPHWKYLNVTTSASVLNSTTTVFSETIPAGTLSANSVIKIRLFGDNAAGNSTFRSRICISFGGCDTAGEIADRTMLDSDAAEGTEDWWHEIDISNRNALNSQGVFEKFIPTNGAVSADGSSTSTVYSFRTLTVDTSVAQTLMIEEAVNRGGGTVRTEVIDVSIENP